MGLFGGKPLPKPDAKLQHTIDTLHLTSDDLKAFWTIFCKHDKDKSGTIDIGEFYEIIEEPRSLFVDGLFELIDSDDTQCLDFTEFVVSICTYGLFEDPEILKYCFFIFDKDKNGYIEEEELDALMEILHDGEQSKGNLATSIKMFKEIDYNSDGKVDFQEFQVLNLKSPMLLYPAFRVQRNMWHHILGDEWWREKQIELNEERERERQRRNMLRIAEEKRLHAIMRRQFDRRHGHCKGCCLYMCPCFCCVDGPGFCRIACDNSEKTGNIRGPGCCPCSCCPRIFREVCRFPCHWFGCCFCWQDIPGFCYKCDRMHWDDPIEVDTSEEGTGMQGHGHHLEKVDDNKDTEYETMMKEHGSAFMGDPTKLAEINKCYKDVPALRNDSLEYRKGNRKDRARNRREERVAVGF
jgi:Ca2+-binding EF-hand superfamily protein